MEQTGRRSVGARSVECQLHYIFAISLRGCENVVKLALDRPCVGGPEVVIDLSSKAHELL